ncbi:unnamed protein product [Cladocopium goreaui]|uniref:CSD domain-containing protein n=1 Tax=Cladocopium goreaui TaxID=2562237 RepID=A0A9P1M698_9DINO|nr:unnamed protein product [Cladocopium goreaui]
MDSSDTHLMTRNPLAGDAILSRCIDFVRKNEDAIRKVHEVNARSFQVQVERGDGELWGITWVREKFLEKRRVVQSLVPNSPAARRIEAGDELVAVNGLKSWEEMSSFKDLRQARLTLVRSPKEDSGEPSAPSTSKDDAKEPTKELRPPAFQMGGYLLDASGSGWSMPRLQVSLVKSECPLAIKHLQDSLVTSVEDAPNLKQQTLD